MQFWNELEGQTVDGLFPLRRLVRSEGRSAWFETETPAPQIGRATISLTEALTDADEVTARLRAAQQVKHPNLVQIVQVGLVTIDSTQVVYAVMEPIEQSLSDVLQTQALSADEGREVAEALVGALTAIHEHGMSHGHVEAASVLATEEKVKLRSDCLQSTAANQGEDVAGIGSTLFQAFTQRKAATATDAQVNRIPAPFGEIVRNALARRWTLAQIANALRPPAPVASVAPPPPFAPSPSAPTPSAPHQRPAPAASAKPVAPAPRAAVPAAKPAADPVTVTPRTVPVAAVAAVAEMEEQPRGIRMGGVYAALAVVVLAVIGWVLLRPNNPAASQSTPPLHLAPSTASPAARPTVAAVPAPVQGPPASVPAGLKPDAATASGNGKVSARTIWRVVVYTYYGQSKAERSVAKIKAAHPDLEASIFNPRFSQVYMVTLGGPMDRPQATALLQKAKREGLPRDTFVRNFSE